MLLTDGSSKLFSFDEFSNFKLLLYPAFISKADTFQIIWVNRVFLIVVIIIFTVFTIQYS